MMRFVKGLMMGALISSLVLIGLGSGKAWAFNVIDNGSGGFLDIDYQVQAREAFSSIGGGPAGDDSMNNLYLRRDRLSFLGHFTETYGFAVQYEYVGGQKIGETAVSQEGPDYVLYLIDAYLTADYADALKLRVGRTKHMLTREVSEGCFDPLSVDRSVFISGPFTTANFNGGDKGTRDVGVTALGNFFSDRFQYRLGIMQGNKYSNTAKPEDVGYRYTGRVHVSLWDPESGWGYKGSYLGKKKVLTLGAGYEMEPNAVYSTGTTGAEKYTAYTYDLFFEYPTQRGTVTLSSAYLKQDFNEAGTRGVADAMGANGEKNGYYVKAAYMLGKFQVYGRSEKWSFAKLNGVAGQQVDWSAEGINYYIKGQELRLTLEYQKIAFDKPGSKDFTTTIAQFQARF